MAIDRGKIVIIGAGHVGSAILNSLLGMNLAREIVLINLDREQALGEVLDASHTLAFAYTAGCTIRVGDYADCADAQIIINTAGPSIRPGEKHDRMALLETNLQEILDSDRAKAIYHGFQHRQATEALCRRCGYARRFG